MLTAEEPKTTLLGAVNSLLSAIGETPVNSLDGPLPGDVALALNTLVEVSRAVQSEGWVCNTEHDHTLLPDSSGVITVPLNTLKTIFHDPSTAYVTARGTRLYDLANHTYRFDGPVSLTLVTFLSFPDLTETLRRYITVKAARVFQDKSVGSPTLHGFHERDELEAKAEALRENTQMGRWNVQKGTTSFMGTWSIAKTLRRS